MSEQSNIAKVQAMYAAFGRGDVPAILADLNPDVRWVNPGPRSVPYAGERRGPDEVRQFFETLYATVDVASFEPREFYAAGERVVVLGRWTGRAKATGRAFADEWAMAMTLKDGKLTSFRAYEDTYNLAQAYAA